MNFSNRLFFRGIRSSGQKMPEVHFETISPSVEKKCFHCGLEATKAVMVDDEVTEIFSCDNRNCRRIADKKALDSPQ